MKEEIEVFAERAKKFEEVAKYLYRTEVFDLSAFNVEQALQLYFKFILAKELGYFPKTHSLTRLFNDLSKLDKSFFGMINTLEKFKERFKEWLSRD